MSKNIDLLVVGDAFIDILVPVAGISPDGAFERDIKVTAGGLANTAAWASRLNATVAFVGKVGDDIFGQTYHEDLINEKVLPALSLSNKPTGKCILLVDGRRRTMILDRGANDDLTIKDVPDNLLKRSKYIYFSGYSFASKILQKEIKKIMKDARAFGKTVVFNGGAHNLIKDNHLFFEKIIEEYVDIFALNEDEAEIFTGEKILKRKVAAIKDIGTPFIVTLGKKGSIAFDGKHTVRTKIKPVAKVVDITGAGDAFMGGFLAGLSKDKTFKESISFGHATARKVVTRVGAR
ncbi:MAG: adenosine kinase [Thermodesulfobacteriota bacterium]